MTITKPLLGALLCGFALSVGLNTRGAAAADAPAPPSQGTAYTDNGADTCLMCHAAWPYPILPIFKTKHGQRDDPRSPFARSPGTPFAGLQCETCHGPGAKHAGSGDKNAINSHKPTSFLPPEERSKVCLGCHENNARTGWHASTHENNGIACTDCHRLHVERDPVRATASQPQVCYKCHRKTRAEYNLPSVHPVRAGTISCSDCHSPHGSTSDGMLVKPTVNQTCFTCHAEKRGPFLWEHAPAAENCTICHHPHGSVYHARLKKNPPLLCQQCHTVSGHPAVARTPAGLPGGSAGASGFLLAGGCINCHSQVHGSNHPSGVKLMR